MQSTELRIGNLVYGINRRGEVHLPINLPLKILQIELFNCEVLPYNINPATEENWHKITNSDLSPIKLTEQWLINFGIEKDEYGDYEIEVGRIGIRIDFAQDDNLVLLYRSDIGVDYVWIQFLDYVHQFQNTFFSLTNKELITVLTT